MPASRGSRRDNFLFRNESPPVSLLTCSFPEDDELFVGESPPSPLPCSDGTLSAPPMKLVVVSMSLVVVLALHMPPLAERISGLFHQKMKISPAKSHHPPPPEPPDPPDPPDLLSPPATKAVPLCLNHSSLSRGQREAPLSLFLS
ncbi:hypothetical protein AALP_AAs67487U000300 [Arabis alpina]|uniref:Uncharacterized protein n=1 Tax=Arabis alpina TaxID=50452 RepID=A0A087FXZ6_ARAAL|nr:hypothetical protein AALP_AAs67487U000300 [Arabis alpina]